jgi:hypothetical protein
MALTHFVKIKDRAYPVAVRVEGARTGGLARKIPMAVEILFAPARCALSLAIEIPFLVMDDQIVPEVGCPCRRGHQQKHRSAKQAEFSRIISRFIMPKCPGLSRLVSVHRLNLTTFTNPGGGWQLNKPRW